MYLQTSAKFSVFYMGITGMQLILTMNFPIQLCIIHVCIVSWANGEAIQGENVRDATENEFPFVVAISDVRNDINFSLLSRLLNPRQFCTGALITKKHVLTAEHCLLTKQVHEVEVLAGSTNLDQCKAYDPEKWITWQEWKHNSSTMFAATYHDVAVITLKKCVSESNIIPAVLSKSSRPSKLFGASVKFAGWGWTNDAVKPEILKTVDLKVLSNTDCLSKLSQMAKKTIPLMFWHLCAISEPRALNLCGDSGGPLINNRNKIVGIAIGTCPSVKALSENHPRHIVMRLLEDGVNIYSNLYYYRDFVQHFTNESHHCRLMK